MRYIDLNQGLESRLLFIKDHYPELTALAADRLWTSCFEMRGRGKEMKELFRRINKEYSDLFSSGLKQSRVYRLADKDSIMLPLYLFYQRVNKFIHRRPLKRIKAH